MMCFIIWLIILFVILLIKFGTSYNLFIMALVMALIKSDCSLSGDYKIM